MSSSAIGVLVFPAGEINSIELHDALATCVNIKLFGASSTERHGPFVFQNYIGGLPNIKEQGFLEEFNTVLKKNKIDVVIPTHDDVALFMAKNRAKLSALILTADERTNEVCRDKLETYKVFADCSFCPDIYDFPKEYPVFIKPRKGQGSVGARKLIRSVDLPSEEDRENFVICEYLPGEELTVDCFTDSEGNLQAVLPRSRQRIFGGVSVRASREQLTQEIKDMAICINERMHFLGLWYFQVKQDSTGRYKLMEISTRCAGTMCLSRALGVNLPLLSVYAALGKKTEVLMNEYDVIVDRTLISRYRTDLDYKRVYIDLDDTLLIRGQVNLQLIRFLYQCVNQGKEIILVTRHGSDHSDSVEGALRKHKIPLELFDDIAELDFTVSKDTVIDPTGAIFIDNSFVERKAVYEKLKIPVFDVDEIEVLLDWRL